MVRLVLRYNFRSLCVHPRDLDGILHGFGTTERKKGFGEIARRCSAYRRIACEHSMDELERLLAELRDRYGPPSVSILNLAEFARLRILADGLGLESVERDGRVVMGLENRDYYRDDFSESAATGRRFRKGSPSVLVVLIAVTVAVFVLQILTVRPGGTSLVQSWLQLQIFTKKFFKMVLPSAE